jgi:hypothetical protein
VGSTGQDMRELLGVRLWPGRLGLGVIHRPKSCGVHLGHPVGVLGVLADPPQDEGAVRQDAQPACPGVVEGFPGEQPARPRPANRASVSVLDEGDLVLREAVFDEAGGLGAVVAGEDLVPVWGAVHDVRFHGCSCAVAVYRVSVVFRACGARPPGVPGCGAGPRYRPPRQHGRGRCGRWVRPNRPVAAQRCRETARTTHSARLGRVTAVISAPKQRSARWKTHRPSAAPLNMTSV